MGQGRTTTAKAPAGLAFKSGTVELEGITRIASDSTSDEGIVEAIVSVTGVEDSVADIIEPGAYALTLKARNPKVCWAHDWEKPIGRTLHIEEWLPGDSRLPKTTKDGKPWPRAAGALVATMQFNLKSERGREAFEAVKFYSESSECEWSIGYLAAKSSRGKDGIRRIKQVDLFELSFVLFGAASLSSTLSLKDAIAAMRLSDADVDALLDALDVDALLLEEFPGLPDDATDDATGERIDVDALDQLGDHLALRGDIDSDEQPAGEPDEQGERFDPAALLALLEDAVSAPGPDAAVVAATQNTRDDPDGAQDGTESTPGAEAPGDGAQGTDGGGKAAQPRIEAKYDESPVGDSGGRRNWVDEQGGLPKFVRAVAHALIRAGRDKSTAIRIAIGRIRDWADGKGKVTAKTCAKAQRAIAEWDRKRASARAKALVTDWGWDPMLEVGRHAAHKAAPVFAEAGTKLYGVPRMPGTWEERRDALNAAVEIALRGDPIEAPAGDSVPAIGVYEWTSVTLDGTWEDRVIATRYNYREPGEPCESFEISYEWDGTRVILGDPVPVTLSIRVDVEGSDAGEDVDPEVLDALGLVDAADGVAAGAKSLLRVEGKAGRVLSGPNGERIRAAVQALMAVLKAAGIDVTADPKMPAPTTPPTAPAAPPAPVTPGAPVASTEGKGAEPLEGDFDADALLALLD